MVFRSGSSDYDDDDDDDDDDYDDEEPDESLSIAAGPVSPPLPLVEEKIGCPITESMKTM